MVGINLPVKAAGFLIKKELESFRRVWIHTYIHTYMHTYIHAHTDTAHVSLRNALMSLFLQVLHNPKRPFLAILGGAKVNVHTHLHIHTYIHTYILTYLLTYICIQGV